MSQGTLKVFCLANGNLRREVMVQRFANAMTAMLEQAPQPGPWMYGIYADGIKQLTLYGESGPQQG
ncbi:MAG TPA: hypothetical protein PLZ93_05330 [Nocardioides sp.]|nr:hypothetical protein [Nocardioides sp.]HRI95011.1 hypothetical protein [Nocardioides sp.]HRK44888.1 hypothetical protein [Nocardioides sp.]